MAGLFCLLTSFQEQNLPILSAGLNWIRVPLVFWAIEMLEGEPYLEMIPHGASTHQTLQYDY